MYYDQLAIHLYVKGMVTIVGRPAIQRVPKLVTYRVYVGAPIGRDVYV